MIEIRYHRWLAQVMENNQGWKRQRFDKIIMDRMMREDDRDYGRGAVRLFIHFLLVRGQPVYFRIYLPA